MQSLHERNIGKDQRTKLKEGRGADENYERKHIFSNDTQIFENHVNPSRKIKFGHLEGEFKKIKPTSFYKE